MTINEQIIHLIKTAGPITSADLYDKADLVENRKQLSNSINRLRRKGMIEITPTGWIINPEGPAESPEEPDADDPLANTEDTPPPPATTAPARPRPTLVSVPAPPAKPAQPAPAPATTTDPWLVLHRKTQTVLDQLLRDDNIDGLLSCVIEIRDMALDNLIGRED